MTPGRMNRRYVLPLAMLALLGCCALIFVERVRYPVIGWLRGEAFFEGMPTSYWSASMRWVENYVNPESAEEVPVEMVLRAVSHRAAEWYHDLRLGWLEERWQSIRRLEESPAGDGVLRELARDLDPRVRQEAFARLINSLDTLPAEDLIAFMDRGSSWYSQTAWSRNWAAELLAERNPRYLPFACDYLVPVLTLPNDEGLSARALYRKLCPAVPTARKALPALIELYEDPFVDKAIRDDALETIRAIDPGVAARLSKEPAHAARG
jgi:hypothetical protein